MDEPTSSLEPREVERLFAAIEMLRAEGVSLHLRVTSSRRDLPDLRLGHRAARRATRPSGPVARADPARAHRPRCSAARSPRSGRSTGFGDETAVTGERGAPRGRGLTRRHLLDGVDVTVHAARWSGWPACWGRAGAPRPPRPSTARNALDRGSVGVDGRAGALRVAVRAAIEAGIALHPRGPQGRGHRARLSVRDNITLGVLPSLSSRSGHPGRRPTRLVDELIERLHIKISSRDQKVAELSGGNQQKVLLARMLAVHARAADPRRSDAGHRRGRQGGDPGPRQRAGGPGPVGRAHQLRPRRGRGRLTRAWSCSTAGGRRLARAATRSPSASSS